MFSEWLEAITSFATVGALLAALWQLRRGLMDARARDDDRRVERALALYEAITAEGATFEAFHRFSILMRQIGSVEHGRTTWHVVSDKDLDPGGLLDPSREDRGQAFADLYAVMWYFERCQIAVRRGLVNPDVLMETAGFDIWWWGQVLRDLHGPRATLAVAEMTNRASDWAVANSQYEDWEVRCLTDFDGGPAISPSIHLAGVNY